MKTIARFILISLVALSALAASAQDAEFFFDPFFAFSQTATDGSLTANGDNTYTLVLNGVTEFSPWMASPLAFGNMPTLDLERGVQTGTPVTLSIGFFSIEMAVVSVDFDSETSQTMIYTVMITQMTGPDVTEKTPYPTEFEDAILFIPVGAEFLDALTSTDSNLRAEDIGGDTGYNCERIANIVEMLSFRDDNGLLAYWQEKAADFGCAE